MSQPFRESLRLAVYLRDGLRCTYCDAGVMDVCLTLDHVDTRDHHPSNLVTACWACNSSKAGLALEAWAEKRGVAYRNLRRRVDRRVERSIETAQVAAQAILALEPPTWWERQRQLQRERARYRQDQCPWCPTTCPWCVPSPDPEDPEDPARLPDLGVRPLLGL